MENLYHKVRNFSRKDLQGLCKKYGLPANASNSEMATSLILFLKKKNLGIRIWEGPRSDFFTSRGDQKKGCGRRTFHSGSCNKQCHNDLQNCKNSSTSDKTSTDMGSLTQHRESISCSGVSSPILAPSPSFTFDVCCEGGIQLYVDLNSSPADWIESLKSGVHISQDVHMSQSFDEDKSLLCCPKERNGSFTISPTESDNGQLQVGSSPTTILTDNMVQTDELDEVKWPFPSPGLKSFSSVIHSLGNAKDRQGDFSSRLNSGSHGQHPNAKSRRREEMSAADSDVTEAVQTRTCCDFIGNSVPSDLKCSTKPAHQGADTDNGICKKPPLQLFGSSLDPVLSTTISMEMEASNCTTLSQDIECSPSGIQRYVNAVDQLKNNKVVQSGIVESFQTPNRDEFQIWPSPAVHQSSCSSSLLSGLPLYLADDKSNVETEHRRSWFFRNSDRQKREAQSHSAGNHSKSSCDFYCHRYASQGVVNLANGIETKNTGFLRTQEAGSEPDKLQQKDATLYPCPNDDSLGLVFPKKNVDCQISPKSNELHEDICRIPSKCRRSSRLFAK